MGRRLPSRPARSGSLLALPEEPRGSLIVGTNFAWLHAFNLALAEVLDEGDDLLFHHLSDRRLSLINIGDAGSDVTSKGVAFVVLDLEEPARRWGVGYVCHDGHMGHRPGTRTCI